MERRQFLTGCGALLAGVGAGCAGVFETPDGPTPAATPDAGPSTPDPPPAETPTPGPTETPEPTPEPTPTATPADTLARREALTAYRAGHAGLDAYDRDTYVARVGFERAKYGGAAVRYRDAVDRADQSATYFDWAAGWAARADRPAARTLAADAATYTRRFLLAFARRGVDAAEAAKAGRLDEAGEHVAAMRALSRGAASADVGVAEPLDFEERVGL
jgi:hypothetical protein